MKFYVTERGEMAYQLPTLKRTLSGMTAKDALLAITKCIDHEAVQDLLLQYKNKTIVHATITGFGGSDIEPRVCSPNNAIGALKQLIDRGFPAKQIVLRIDPIVPTDKGIETARKVLSQCPDDVRRIRFSFIDGYKNIKAYLPWDSFHAPTGAQRKAIMMLHDHAGAKSLEACGEPQLNENIGCISTRDYEILGLPIPFATRKGQRKGCMCLGNKTEALSKPRRCPNGCIYCYYNLG